MMHGWPSSPINPDSCCFTRHSQLRMDFGFLALFDGSAIQGGGHHAGQGVE
jgi:hypothetical protein